MEIVPHEDYINMQAHNDIALLKLEEEVMLEFGIIPLFDGDSEDILGNNTGSLIVAGWGRTEYKGESPSQLMETNLNYMSDFDCDAYLNSNHFLDNVAFNSYDSRGKLCAQGDMGATCQGDR